MAGKPKRLNHPVISYIMGFIVLALAFVVLAGVVYHLTISERGPGLLRPLWKKYEARQKSPILEAVQRQQELEKHRHFHNIAAPVPKLPENLRPVCFICHSDLPHSKNKRIRSLMNLHTQFLVCETCHIKEKPGTTIVYKWYNPLNSNPPGPFYGTSYDPETGSLSLGKDLISKIAPYFKSEKDGSLQLEILVQDAPMARDFMRVRDRLTPDQIGAITNKFHESIKAKGLECHICHSENSILDFKQLGFVENRANNLEHLFVVGMIEKYQSWYLPELVTEGLH